MYWTIKLQIYLVPRLGDHTRGVSAFQGAGLEEVEFSNMPCGNCSMRPTWRRSHDSTVTPTSISVYISCYTSHTVQSYCMEVINVDVSYLATHDFVGQS